MYSWTWRHLPGPLVARLLQVLVLLAAAVALLFFVIFPAVEQLLPYNDVTVGNSNNTAPGPSLHITSLHFTHQTLPNNRRCQSRATFGRSD
jgi:hypothetical protein